LASFWKNASHRHWVRLGDFASRRSSSLLSREAFGPVSWKAAMTDPQFDEINPYAPPLTSLERPELTVADERAVVIRRKNLGHETAIRAIGMVHFLCAGIDAVLVTIALYSSLEIGLGMWSRMASRERVDWVTQVFVAIPPLIGMHIFLGRGLRRLEPWAFRVQVGLSGAVLAGFIITLYWQLFGEFFPDLSLVSKFAYGIAHFAVLYYFLSSKCRRVFEPSHREAVVETPELKVRRSWLLIVGIVPFAIAFDWGVLVTTWRVALAIAGALGFEI
jgi:hypothetical protein